MNEEEKVSDIYEIDVNKKYIIAFEYMLSDETMERIKNDVKEWLAKENSPFLFLRGVGNGIKLVKVEE